jgi:hypothetical protein
MATVFLAFALSPQAKAQWLNGKLAIRTNGNNFQSGDQLKVELLALDSVHDRFYTQVFYSYNETIPEKDEDGNVKEKQVEKRISRQQSPVLEGIKPFQMLTLDDSFYFGDASPTGRYTVQVSVFEAYTNRLLMTLKSCVFFQSSSEGEECDTFLRAIKTVHHEMFFTFEGRFNPRALYSVTFLNKNRVIRHIPVGAAVDGSRILHLSSDKLDGLAGQTADILILDYHSGVSSTLSRVTIASVR